MLGAMAKVAMAMWYAIIGMGSSGRVARSLDVARDPLSCSGCKSGVAISNLPCTGFGPGDCKAACRFRRLPCLYHNNIITCEGALANPLRERIEQASRNKNCRHRWVGSVGEHGRVRYHDIAYTLYQDIVYTSRYTLALIRGGGDALESDECLGTANQLCCSGPSRARKYARSVSRVRDQPPDRLQVAETVARDWQPRPTARALSEAT